YAKALYAISKESGSLSNIQAQLLSLSEALNDQGIRDFINNPDITLSQKKTTINKVLESVKLASEVKSFVNLLIDRKRVTLLPEIATVFGDIVDNDNGVTRGSVISAKPLTDEALASLENKITQVLKKKIVLTAKEDPSMIAGVVAKVGGWTFDDSLETHLKNLNEELLNH
ncbi:MAG: ATP synthase F1 subunit delta, partial [Bdellovibrionales bacterium]|nr:ATP synthase F1 subunit delta [Bdellovibrionales bacterium]